MIGGESWKLQPSQNPDHAPNGKIAKELREIGKIYPQRSEASFKNGHGNHSQRFLLLKWKGSEITRRIVRVRAARCVKRPLYPRYQSIAKEGTSTKVNQSVGKKNNLSRKKNTLEDCKKGRSRKAVEAHRKNMLRQESRYAERDGSRAREELSPKRR